MTIRESIIAKSISMGIGNANQLAVHARKSGVMRPTRSTIYRYWNREDDLTGELLDELFRVLELAVTNKK